MLLFGIVLSGVSYLVIELFFDDYYYSEQEKTLVFHTEELRDGYNETGTSDLQPLIDEYAVDHGMSVHFLETDTGNLHGSSLQGSGKQGLSFLFNREKTDEVFISTTRTQNSSNDWLSYLIQTDDGNLILGRISYNSMDSVVDIVQQFFVLFGISLAIIFFVFTYLFSKSMSKPLNNLNAIAEKMGQLDFSLKYEGTREDEIGQLGKTLNEITNKLENTITQLKGELTKEKTLDKLRTQFTAQVSHELQTPLSVIKGYSEALSDKIYSETEAFGIYDILLNETEKISNMVDDLLDLSQMESGVYVIRKEKFSLPQLVRKIYNRHKDLPYDKLFSINLDIDYPIKVAFSGDALRLEQAIRNILTNAIKHVAPNGLIQIKLALTDGKTSISIYNQGESIPDDDISHIFKSYYQGRKTRGGTGLGLAITKHIVELHGGLVTAENTAGGVIFKIVFNT